MGLLDRDIIPPGWEEHHRPVATGTMTAVCDIIAPGERASILDDAAETVAAAGVKCRVQQQNQGLNGSGPGQETTTREYLVTLPHDVGVEFRTGVDGHKIRITSANNPHIVGRVFDVKQVLHGSLVWETDLYCEDNQTQNERVNGL